MLSLLLKLLGFKIRQSGTVLEIHLPRYLNFCADKIAEGIEIAINGRRIR